jgi:hypothetical protein
LRKELIDLRAHQAGPHLEAALYDLEYLATQAAKFDLKLALLTPQAYTDFPLPEEMNLLLEEFGDPVYYWHDVGQAEIFQTLNLLPGQIWLDMFAAKTIGAHLHQTRGLEKWLPFQPEARPDLENLTARLPRETLLTCKFASAYPPEAIKESLSLLGKVFEAT